MKQVFKLALPSIISNITVPLLGIIDLTIVGHMGDVIYIGAIAIGTMIFNVLYWLFGFLRMGTSGMTSQALGRRDLTEAMRLLVRSLTISTAIAVIFIVFQLPIRWMALSIMQPTEHIAEQAVIYFSICIWGAPAMLGLYGLTGWFIGMQNTRIPMLVSIFQNIVNIVASGIMAGWLNIIGKTTCLSEAQWFDSLPSTATFSYERYSWLLLISSSFQPDRGKEPLSCLSIRS